MTKIDPCDVCNGLGEIHDPVDGKTKECYACDGKGFIVKRDFFGNERVTLDFWGDEDDYDTEVDYNDSES